MDDFTKLSWWVAFVGAGFFWLLVRDYIWPPINRGLSSVSAKWRARSDAARARREEIVAKLRADKHEQLMMLGTETHAQLRSITFLLFSILFLIAYIVSSGETPEPAFLRAGPLTSAAAYWMSAVTMLFFLWTSMTAMRYARLLREARSKKPAEAGLVG